MPSVKQATLAVTSPYDGKPLAEVPMNNADDIERMLQTAQALHKNRGHWLKPYQRIEILSRLIQAMSAEKEALALQIAQEGGKPLLDAKIETDRAIDGVGLAIKALGELKGTEIPMGLTPSSENRVAFTIREPIGIVVAVSAFNHPLNLIIHQVIPAIAVGCPVIIKPASKTPLSCLRVAELLTQSGLPEGWCQVCICDNTLAEKLVTDSRVGFFSFIGSARVGWHLHSKLAPGVRSTLEHGGAAPVIVDKDADLKMAVPKLLKGGFYHAGQVCVSVQRIFAEKSLAKTLAHQLAEGASQLVVGDPTDIKTQVGPIISSSELDRIDQWIQEAIQAGATCLTGGKKRSNSLYEPTVLFNPPAHVKLSTAEIFGPVVAVYEYDNIDQAIAQANSLDLAFQAAIFSNNFANIMKATQELDATAVMVNDHTAFRVDWMPFGGRRHSGLGLGGIVYTMHEMTQDKLIVMPV